MTAAALAHRLGARQFGPGRWLARCPAHDDRQPSLSIREGEGERVLVHCWAGCATTAVLAALGLTWRDICGEPATAAERAQLRHEREQRQMADAAERRQRDSVRAAQDALAKHASRLVQRLAALEWSGATPAHAGETEALATDYHNALDSMHDLEAA